MKVTDVLYLQNVTRHWCCSSCLVHKIQDFFEDRCDVSYNLAQNAFILTHDDTISITDIKKILEQYFGLVTTYNN